MDLYQMIIVTIAIANLAVTVWLLWLLIPVWKTLRKVVFALDHFDFERLVRQFLDGERPLAENVSIKVSENKEEGYKELTVTRIYKKPLDAKEIQENFVRQMAKEMQ